MNTEKPRQLHLDLLRSAAILPVIMTHCITGLITSPALYGSRSWQLGIILNAFSCTGVPLFFMISGALLLSAPATREILPFYRRRIPRLCIPLIIWSVIYFAADVLIFQKQFSFSAFFAGLFNNGVYYHMWFIYTMAGMYLFTPFLKRIVDACSLRELCILLLLVLFPGTLRPIINLASPVYIYLFGPLLEGYLGFFLLGYLLNTAELGPRVRAAVYLGGAAGVVISVVGNALSSSSEGINLIFNIGYSLPRYLVAAAIFVLAKYGLRRITLRPWATRAITALSGLSFGVYWVHALLLELIRMWIPLELSPIYVVVINFLIVTAASYAVMYPLSRVKTLKTLLM